MVENGKPAVVMEAEMDGESRSGRALSREQLLLGRLLDDNAGSPVLAPYLDYWREMVARDLRLAEQAAAAGNEAASAKVEMLRQDLYIWTQALAVNEPRPS